MLGRRTARDRDRNLIIVQGSDENPYLPAPVVAKLGRKSTPWLPLYVGVFPAGSTEAMKSFYFGLDTVASAVDEWRRYLDPPLFEHGRPDIPIDAIERLAGSGGVRVATMKLPDPSEVELSAVNEFFDVQPWEEQPDPPVGYLAVMNVDHLGPSEVLHAVRTLVTEHLGEFVEFDVVMAEDEWPEDLAAAWYRYGDMGDAMMAATTQPDAKAWAAKADATYVQELLPLLASHRASAFLEPVVAEGDGSDPIDRALFGEWEEWRPIMRSEPIEKGAGFSHREIYERIEDPDAFRAELEAMAVPALLYGLPLAEALMWLDRQAQEPPSFLQNGDEEW